MDPEKLREDLVFSGEIAGATFQFRTTWGLFSPRAVDDGTRLLMQHTELGLADDVLDLGCGWGPIGCAAARLAPGGRTLMVDKDFVAVEYAARNAELNSLKNAEVRLSNGFSHVRADEHFDVILCNLPAKTGKELWYLLLLDAHARLREGGALRVVTISGIRSFMKRAMTEVFGNYDKVKQGRSYTVSAATRLPR